MMSIKDYSNVYFNSKGGNRMLKNDNNWYEVLRPFILSVIGNFKNILYCDMEDLEMIAWIGATKAINSFKPDGDASFLTYAKKCINNELLMQARKNKKYYKNYNDSEEGYVIVNSLDERVNDTDGKDITLCDLLEDETILNPEDTILVNDMIDNIYDCCKNEVDKTIVKMRLEGYKQREIAEVLGYSKECTVSARLSRIYDRYNKKFK